MTLQHRLETLRSRHAHLEAEIDRETSRPLPDASMISDLKRQKLKIKDEMVALERQH